MSHEEFLKMVQQDERDMAAMNAYYEEVEQHAAAWREQWPDHCRACHGWGLHGHVSLDPQDGGPEPCEEMIRQNGEDFCHRCGGTLKLEEFRSEMSCMVCGWSCGEDGEPLP